MKQLVADFETTVYDGQTKTEVWASASVELYTENVFIFNSIKAQFNFFKTYNQNLIVYYHNLKFDGMFWLDFLLTKTKIKSAYDEDLKEFPKKLKANTFKTLISDTGQFYSITIQLRNMKIELRDSLKLLPFSVDVIGKSFDTKHRKLSIEYVGERHAGGVISDEDRAYIRNDVLVVKEALEYMFNNKHDKMTIGSCCFAEFKKFYGDDYNNYFPDLTTILLNEERFNAKTADEYIRKSYKGGWTYVVEEKANKIYHNGLVLDVNSLYPSVMHSESGSKYPYGLPTFWSGNYIPDICYNEDVYFFVRIKTQFKIKENYLPFIQNKSSLLYKPNKCLRTSDIYDSKRDKYFDSYIDKDGIKRKATMTITLTMTDYKLFLEHYTVDNFVILDGCYFSSKIGLFDSYINKYKEMKINAPNKAVRTLAKLFLNNLYGKMATNENADFKIPYLKDDRTIGFKTVIGQKKKAGYIAIGSAITSYARNFTIRIAQANYYGPDKKGFIYADTDSIHADLNINDVKGVTIHDSNFCCWKCEALFDEAIYVRQKTYIEHITHEDMKPLEKPKYNITCAGMPERCKKLYIDSITQDYIEKDYNYEELQFIKTKRTITDFAIGLKVPSKLMPKTIKGGVVLKETEFTMR